MSVAPGVRPGRPAEPTPLDSTGRTVVREEGFPCQSTSHPAPTRRRRTEAMPAGTPRLRPPCRRPPRSRERRRPCRPPLSHPSRRRRSSRHPRRHPHRRPPPTHGRPTSRRRPVPDQPIQMSVPHDPGQSRLWGIPFLGIWVRALLLIPVGIELFFLFLAAAILVLVSWIPVLVQGRQAPFITQIVGGDDASLGPVRAVRAPRDGPLPVVRDRQRPPHHDHLRRVRAAEPALGHPRPRDHRAGDPADPALLRAVGPRGHRRRSSCSSAGSRC